MGDIKKIYVGGCSWAYGDELSDPDADAWAALLAKKLDAKLLHKGACGNSNEGIWLGLMGFLNTGYVDGWTAEHHNFDDLLVILQWSFPSRSVMNVNVDALGTEWREKIKLDYLDMPISPGAMGRNFYKLDIFSDDVKFWKRKWEEWVYVEYNSKSLYRKSLFYMVSCMSLLENMGIPYLSVWGPVQKNLYSTDGPFGGDELYWVENDVLSKYNHYHIDDSFASYIAMFPEATFGPRMHPLEKAHEIWFNRICELLNYDN